MRVVQREVPLAPVPESIAVARSVVRAVAGDGVVAVGDAELLTSELVTNAIRYGGSDIELSVVLDADGLTVTVHDDGGELPRVAPAQPPAGAVSGRGLQMVAQVADSWGVSTDDERTGKRVWFTMAAGAPRAPATRQPRAGSEVD